jgi:hypothetical protein
MTTGNTTLLGLALPVDGELDGSWGDVVNDSITSLVDSAVAGTTTLPTDADVTLTDTVLASNQARQAILLWTASNGATTRNVTAPARSKPYIVINAGTGSIVLRGAGPTTGVTIVSGERCLAAWSGSDFVKVATSVVSVNLATQVTGTLPVANGGTGVTSATGTGSVVLSSSPTLVTPALGTPASGNLSNCTVDGTNAVGYRKVPSAGSAKTTNYTLATSDIGEYVEVGSGGSITIPDATFSSGDVVSIFNNTASGITITCSITTAYKAGINTDQSSVTLQTRGVCTVLFISGTVCVIAGNLA